MALTWRPRGEVLATAIVERAAGNPLFLRELVQVTAGERADALPESVEDVIGTQIDRPVRSARPHRRARIPPPATR